MKMELKPALCHRLQDCLHTRWGGGGSEPQQPGWNYLLNAHVHTLLLETLLTSTSQVQNHAYK